MIEDGNGDKIEGYRIIQQFCLVVLLYILYKINCFEEKQKICLFIKINLEIHKEYLNGLSINKFDESYFTIQFLFLSQEYLLLLQQLNKHTGLMKTQSPSNWKNYSYLFNKNKNIQFKCPCTKIYKSFPALYLHCQRKHGVRIVAEQVKQQCQNANSEKLSTFTYIPKLDQMIEVKELSTKKSEVFGLQSLIYRHLEEESFRQKELEEQRKAQLIINVKKREILQKFLNFLILKMDYYGDDQRLEFINDIPYSFNPFYLFQMRAVNQQFQNSKEVVDVLDSLGKWLKKQGHTNLETQVNLETGFCC